MHLKSERIHIRRLGFVTLRYNKSFLVFNLMWIEMLMKNRIYFLVHAQQLQKKFFFSSSSSSSEKLILQSKFLIKVFGNKFVSNCSFHTLSKCWKTFFCFYITTVTTYFYGTKNIRFVLSGLVFMITLNT